MSKAENWAITSALVSKERGFQRLAVTGNFHKKNQNPTNMFNHMQVCVCVWGGVGVRWGDVCMCESEDSLGSFL